MNDTPALIRRADYRPLPWTITDVDLHFALDPGATVVTSHLTCVRRMDVPDGPLPLDFEDLEILSIAIDGAPAGDRAATGGQRVGLTLAGDAATVTVVTRLNPTANTALSGLYRSRGGFFTQCEAEGFRRITAFPDRPDVMARFTVTLEADAAACPVLLSNGNPVATERLAGGRHRARWVDPHPKPCYLFALVAADLVCIEKALATASGRPVTLQVFVEAGNEARAEFALTSLEHALRWDEVAFGLELDLDRYMVVAVSDFNMGAMENKGLNLFNTKYVLASPETATDTDFANIESVIGHEYFHNWTGNRVTCRDWFQLTLKEGLTVFRDQQFSADRFAADADDAAAAASARAVKRIDDVRRLRAAQFPEDAGPMAHPIRPDAYQAIDNFYTATVYEKGAEVIRMLHTLEGAAGFRAGMDEYFRRHDGQAVTCDDFVAAHAAANGLDLTRFLRWYATPGTPRVTAQGDYDAASRTYTLTLTQTLPGHPDAPPLVIPVAVGLLGADGADLPLGANGAGTQVLTLQAHTQTFSFPGLATTATPVPSLLRGFSAPVDLVLDESDATLAFRMAHDGDPFNRWDAAQRYAERVLLARAGNPAAAFPDDYFTAVAALAGNHRLDPAFRAAALALPAEAWLLERRQPADPAALRAALIDLTAALGARLAGVWQAVEAASTTAAYRVHPGDAGRRALRALAMRYRCGAGEVAAIDLAARRYAGADNMSDRMAALAALMLTDAPARGLALADFRARFDGDALVLDKWFALQAAAWRAGADGRDALAVTRALTADPAYAPGNPNKVYALLGSFFKANAAAFHRADGAGHAFWAEQVVALDALNPQIAARIARALERWRGLTPPLQASAEAALACVAAHAGLSADVREVIGAAQRG